LQVPCIHQFAVTTCSAQCAILNSEALSMSRWRSFDPMFRGQQQSEYARGGRLPRQSAPYDRSQSLTCCAAPGEVIGARPRLSDRVDYQFFDRAGRIPPPFLRCCFTSAHFTALILPTAHPHRARVLTDSSTDGYCPARVASVA